MSDNTGYDSVINLAMSLGSSLMFVTSRPAASSISDATANPVTATGAFTTGGPVLSPPDGAAGGYVSNAASVVAWVRVFTAAGSASGICANGDRFGSVQKIGAHCAAASVMSSDPYTSTGAFELTVLQ